MAHTDDGLAQAVRIAAVAFIAGQDAEARRLLEAAPEPPANARVALSPRLRLRIYRRDGFLCRYCSRETLFEPALRLLSELAPEVFPFHPNWKRGFVHPAYPTLTPSCDHLVPVARGGAAVDPMNLVTACARCQYSKGDYLLSELRGVELQPCRPSEWNGLTELYAQLFDLVCARQLDETARAAIQRSHRPWLAAVASGEVETIGPEP